GALAPSGTGTRLLWYSRKAAFRAGRLDGGGNGRWDDGNIGLYSVALGVNTLASHQASFAVGENSRAMNSAAIAMGLNATAEGPSAFAVGGSTLASGTSS